MRYFNMEIILMLMELKCLMNIAADVCIIIRTNKQNSIWLSFVFGASIIVTFERHLWEQ